MLSFRRAMTLDGIIKYCSVQISVPPDMYMYEFVIVRNKCQFLTW